MVFFYLCTVFTCGFRPWMNILNKMTRVELISAPREAYPDKFGGLFWLIFLAAVKTALMTGRKMKPAA